jgi:hypothetical protein
MVPLIWLDQIDRTAFALDRIMHYLWYSSASDFCPFGVYKRKVVVLKIRSMLKLKVICSEIISYMKSTGIKKRYIQMHCTVQNVKEIYAPNQSDRSE